MCSKADIEGAIIAAMRQLRHKTEATTVAPMEEDGSIAMKTPTTELSDAAILAKKRAVAKKLMNDYLFGKGMALAAVEVCRILF